EPFVSGVTPRPRATSPKSNTSPGTSTGIPGQPRSIAARTQVVTTGSVALRKYLIPNSSPLLTTFYGGLREIALFKYPSAQLERSTFINDYLRVSVCVSGRPHDELACARARQRRLQRQVGVCNPQVSSITLYLHHDRSRA